MQAFPAVKLLIVSAQHKANLNPRTHKHMLVGIQEHPVFSLTIFWIGSKDFPLCFLFGPFMNSLPETNVLVHFVYLLSSDIRICD